jgi:hypothetical protein
MTPLISFVRSPSGHRRVAAASAIGASGDHGQRQRILETAQVDVVVHQVFRDQHPVLGAGQHQGLALAVPVLDLERRPQAFLGDP